MSIYNIFGIEGLDYYQRHQTTSDPSKQAQILRLILLPQGLSMLPKITINLIMNSKAIAHKKGKAESLSLAKLNSSQDIGLDLGEQPTSVPNDHMFKQLEINPTRCDTSTITQLSYLLTQVLHYPNTLQARKHSQANRLGASDLISEESKVHADSTKREAVNKQHCDDCGLIVQEQAIPICSSFQSFPNIGIATYLLFITVKNLSILLLILAVTYSAYALFINITQPSETLSLANLPSKLSYATILLHYNTNKSLEFALAMEGWLLVGVIGLWMVTLFLINKAEIKGKRLVDSNTITAADFSLMIENIPFQYTKQQLQAQFDNYHSKLVQKKFLKEAPKGGIQKFKIRKICKALPYYLLQNKAVKKELQNVQDKITQLKETFADWVEKVRSTNRLPDTKPQREQKYRQFLRLSRQKVRLEDEMQYQSQHQNLSKVGATTIFVSFQHSQTANIIEQLNPQSISGNINYILSCCSSALYFSIEQKGKKLDIKLSRAPEPEDINWNNIGVQFSSIVCRKLVTYFVTAMLLAASFGIVYGLTLLQVTTNSSIITYFVSVTISLLNVLIGVAVEIMTKYERDFTKTNRQISLAIKSIMAQLMNSILVPFITNYMVKKNLYYQNGLTYDIFSLALTNALITPILQWVNIPHLVNRLIAWYKQRPYQKLTLNQEELNKLLEFKEFELGYGYIYYMNMFYFTCFYVTMQPYIVLPTLLGFFLMYWAQKYRLLNNSVRPVPSSELLSDAMGQLIFFSPFVLSIGNLTWYNFLPGQTLNFSNSVYLSRLAALIASAIFFLLPIDSIIQALCSIPDQEVLIYDHCRQKLASEYDRLNPATKEDGLKDFLDFLSDKKKDKLIKLVMRPQKIQQILDTPSSSKEKANGAVFENILGNLRDSSFEEVREDRYPMKDNTQQSLVEDRVGLEDIIQQERKGISFQPHSEYKLIFPETSPVRRNRYNRKRVKKQGGKTSQPSIFDSSMKGYNSNSTKNSKTQAHKGNPYYNIQF